ncbi:hypothetical protein M422DRAFT_51942 [Sphaerobolus stellatus SS14]|uniref:Unplaced genomic scaffold SPHSTscaffold_123, whole genome shotgun sequence n=1 Tax=Sphaerobolus stellatus (strain SS14) TaxID=990650 RepID=A0A0C9VB54_SPHS4|nr:hypothetical protein M422DRAFT_51942 [Sphaerobolus stellatus SS14]
MRGLTLPTSLPISVLLADRPFTIINKYPSAIPLFIDQQSQGDLASNSALNITLADTFSGLIYTTANGGSTSNAGTTRAGFHGRDSSISEYHSVKDLTHFNVGILIQPKNFAIKTSVAEFSAITQHAQDSSRLSQRSAPLMELFSTPRYPPLKSAPPRRQ